MQTLLDSSVLVLNRLWQPVNTCSARRAITLLYLGHAQVVHVDGEQNFLTHDFHSWTKLSCQGGGPEVVRTVMSFLRIPRIIVLSLFDKLPRKDVKFTRENIFLRDQHTCQYCGIRFESRELNIDHVIPRDKGGRTTWENVVCSCVPCNTRKGNKLPREARMIPIREPRPPRWRPFASSFGSSIPHESWRHFVHADAVVGTVELSR
ncbi:MAG TPA: HNH endonuclease [Candidatus Limnocylindrales bacterium]|nr:HNH endonuclease [Candidatus Limnocylindrales bacterium]